MRDIVYEPKAIFFYPIFTFGISSTIVDGIKVLDTPSLYGNLLGKSNILSMIDLVIRRVYLLNSIVLHVALARSLIQLFQHVHFLHICAVNHMVRMFIML